MFESHIAAVHIQGKKQNYAFLSHLQWELVEFAFRQLVPESEHFVPKSLLASYSQENGTAVNNGSKS